MNMTLLLVNNERRCLTFAWVVRPVSVALLLILWTASTPCCHCVSAETPSAVVSSLSLSSSGTSSAVQLLLQEGNGEEMQLLTTQPEKADSSSNTVGTDADPPICNDVHSSRYDPLACWLWKLKIIVPDQEFKQRPFTVKVNGLKCSNFTVDGIDSTYVPSQRTSLTTATATTTNPSINLKVMGISAACSGSYKVSPGMSGGLSTKATSNHDNDDNNNDAVDLTWEFVSDYKFPNSTTTSTTTTSTCTTKQYWMPTALSTNQCQSYLQVSDLHFSGSISARLINLFKGMIEDTVTTQLNLLLCPQLKQAVDPVVTHLMLSADSFLAKYVPTNTASGADDNANNNSTPDADADAGVDSRLNERIRTAERKRSLQSLLTTASLVDFEKDAPLLMKSLRTINHFLDCCYNNVPIMRMDGTTDDDTQQQQNCQTIVTKGMKGIVSVLVNSLADQVKIPLPEMVHNLNFQVPNYGKIQLDIQDLHMMGLDQMDSLSLLSPVFWEEDTTHDDTSSNGSSSHNNNTIFKSHVQTQAGLNLTAKLNITLLSIPGGTFQGDPLTEVFLVQFNTTKLNLLGNLGLAFHRDRFRDLPMGTVLDSFFLPTGAARKNASDERKCLFQSVQSLQVEDLQLHTMVESATFVPQFEENNHHHNHHRILLQKRQKQKRPSTLITKRLEEDLDALVNHGFQLIITEYQSLLTDAMSGWVERPLMTKINRWIDQNIHNKNKQSLPTSSSSDDHVKRAADELFTTDKKKHEYCSSGDETIDKHHHELANFTKFGFLKMLNEYINKPSSLTSINEAIDHWATDVGKDHSRPSTRSPLLGWAAWLSEITAPGISLHLQHLQIDNLGTVQHIDLLSPEIDGMHLRNGFSFGVVNDVNEISNASPRVHASFEIVYRPRNLSATINATLTLSDVFLDGGSILHFDITRLRQLTLSQLLSNGHCAIVSFQQHQIYNNRNVSRIGSFLGNATASVTGPLFQNFTVALDTVEYPNAASLITSVVAWAMNTLRDGLNSASRSSFNEAEKYCSGGQTFGYDDDPPILNDGFKDERLLPIFGIFCAVFVAFNAFFFLFMRYCSNFDRDTEERSIETSGEMSEPLLPDSNEEYESMLDLGSKCNTEVNSGGALVHSPAISAFSRHTVPVFVIGTIVLLLSGNAGSGATVDLYISWNDSQTLSLPSLFTFTLLNTAKDMWQAHIYVLFFLVLIMSGIWPYAKLLMMLASWTTPTTILSSETRGRLLLAMDALSKFALVDTYLFVLMMVAFRYHVEISEKISLDVFISPEAGFYSFLAVTIFSLLVGHFMVFCHRNAEMWHLVPCRRGATQANPRESVLGHNFHVRNSSSGEEERLRLSLRFRVFLLLATLVATILLAVGITQKSFKFEIGGIAGDILGNDRVEYYSLLSLGSSIRQSVREPNSHGILMLEVAYYFYAVVTPFACLAILAFLLVCPMTLPSQRFVLALAEIANAWSAVEVFVISIIASLVEISTFASFIIGTKCDLIDEILKEYFMSALDDPSDATCFTVRSSVEASSCVLVAGVLVNSFIVSVLLRFAHCSVAERIGVEMVSSVAEERPIDDALRHDILPRTIASLLASCRSIKRLVFERSAARPTTIRGYLPQSADTYSVTPDVIWDDQSTLFSDAQQRHSSADDISLTNNEVLETMRTAFG